MPCALLVESKFVEGGRGRCLTSAAVLPCVLQVLRRGAPCCAVPGCACAAQLRHAAGAAAAADTEKWSLEAMGFGPIELFDFLYSQLQTSSPYNQKSGKPRFGGDGLKMAKCLLRDGTTYTKLHALLALHGGASAPQPISTADARGKKNLGFLVTWEIFW